MAKKEIVKRLIDDLTYEVHNVSMDNGKTPIGEVEVACPLSIADLTTMIEKGIDTEAHICKLYTVAKTVELQAAARRAKKTGKIPDNDIARLFAQVPDDLRKDWKQTMAWISQTYREEQTDQ